MREKKRSLARGLMLFPLFALMLFQTAFAGEARIQLGKGEQGTVVEKELSGEKLFSGMALFPGSSEEGSLVLRNDSGQRLFFRLLPASYGSGSRALFDALCLRVTDARGKLCYDGALSASDWSSAAFENGKRETLSLTLYLPREAGSEVAGVSTSFRLRLRFSEKEEGLSGGTGEGSGSGTEGEGGTGGSGGSGGTGDGTGAGGTGGSGSGTGSTGSGSGSGGGTGTGSGNTGSGSGNGGSGAGSGSGGSTGAWGSGSGTSSGGGGSGIRRGYHAASGGGTNAPAENGQPDGIYRKPDFQIKTGLTGGTWELDQASGRWRYCRNGGGYVKDGWAVIQNPYHKQLSEHAWYYFDADGWMAIGWIKMPDDVWYYAHDVSDGDLGALKTGWHQDGDDGNLYYLSRENGQMHTGWLTLADERQQKRQYYFARIEDTYRQNWFYNTGIGRWIYDMLGNRTYGSLYRNEKTPDGKSVDADGVLCGI